MLVKYWTVFVHVFYTVQNITSEERLLDIYADPVEIEIDENYSGLEIRFPLEVDNVLNLVRYFQRGKVLYWLFKCKYFSTKNHDHMIFFISRHFIWNMPYLFYTRQGINFEISQMWEERRRQSQTKSLFVVSIFNLFQHLIGIPLVRFKKRDCLPAIVEY